MGAVSAGESKEFTDGKFVPAIEDIKTDKSKVNKIVMCTGKISHEIAAARDAANLENITIIRLERLYPLPIKEIKSILSGYSNDAKIIWAQDEPANQGAYPFVMTELAPQLGRVVTRASRPTIQGNCSAGVGRTGTFIACSII